MAGNHSLSTTITILGVEIDVEIEYDYHRGYSGTHMEPPEPPQVDITAITSEFGLDLFDTCQTYREHTQIEAVVYTRYKYFRRVETWADPVEIYRSERYTRFEARGETLLDQLHDYVLEQHDPDSYREYYDD